MTSPGDTTLMAELRSLLAACEAEEVHRIKVGLEFIAQGTAVGPYVIDGLIGRGGMGAVYRAHRADGQFEQKVAIKIVDMPLASEFFRERFRAQRQMLASFFAVSGSLSAMPLTLRDPAWTLGAAQRLNNISHPKKPDYLLLLARSDRATGDKANAGETVREALKTLAPVPVGANKSITQTMLELEATGIDSNRYRGNGFIWMSLRTCCGKLARYTFQKQLV